MLPKLGMVFHALLMFVGSVGSVRRIRKEFDFDLIDAHFVYPDGLAACLLGRLFCRPVVVSARGSDINLYKEFPVIRRLLKYTLQKADKVITVSSALKDTVVSLGIAREKVIVIPNGVNADKFVSLPKKEARAELGLSHQQIVLSVGHLTPVKGFDLLIQAVKMLVQQGRYEELLLIIVGEGASRKDLERLASDLGIARHVRLIGEVPHEALASWYSAADLFCLASVREGWPNVILESLSCGTPVLGVRVGGIPEILSSDKVGMVVSRDPKEIADAMVVAFERSWSRESLIAHAHQFTWEHVSESLSSVFKSVLLGARSTEKTLPRVLLR